jgi:hypothetical protein
VALPFYESWPANWQTLAFELSKFYGWPPASAFDLTPSELREACDAANRMTKKKG